MSKIWEYVVWLFTGEIFSIRGFKIRPIYLLIAGILLAIVITFLVIIGRQAINTPEPIMFVSAPTQPAQALEFPTSAPTQPAPAEIEIIPEQADQLTEQPITIMEVDVPPAVVRVTFLDLIFGLLVVFLLLAAIFQGGTLAEMTYGIVPLVTTVVLSLEKVLPTGVFWFLLGWAANDLKDSVMFNEAQGEGFDRIDTTAVYGTAALLLCIANGAVLFLNFPEAVPVWLVWAVFILGLGREMMRIPVLTFVALVSGVAAGFFMLWWLYLIGVVAIMITMMIYSQVGVRSNSAHQTQLAEIPLGSRRLGVIIPFDGILIALCFFALTAVLSRGGNWVIFTFARIH